MKKATGVIGCGNMGAAVIKALGNVIIYDVDKAKRAAVCRRTKTSSASSGLELAKKCGVIILAVKPRDMEDVLREIAPAVDDSKVVISIAVGITTRHIERRLMARAAVIRVMPNMPALVGAGISAISKGAFAGAKEMAVAKNIFARVGEVVVVREDLMDAVTAISGSGPAYFFYLVEVLTVAGTGLGLDKACARKLAVETAFGSARLLKESGEDAQSLRARVTSKGGTTEAAFEKFFEHNLGGILAKGIHAAHNRSREHGRR